VEEKRGKKRGTGVTAIILSPWKKGWGGLIFFICRDKALEKGGKKKEGDAISKKKPTTSPS